MWVYDRLVNLVSGLGTAKDKATGSVFALALMGKDQCQARVSSNAGMSTTFRAIQSPR